MTDWPAIISALALLVAAVGGLVLSVLNSRTLKTVAPIIKETHKVALAVDAAVNGKPPGEQTISEQVEDIHEDIHKASTNPGRTPKERRPK